VNAPALPQRSAHPNVKFTCANLEPMIIDNLPFDKYELEPSPLTQYLLARKQPKFCWQVKISSYTFSTEKFGQLFILPNKVRSLSLGNKVGTC
jgi:integrator complex subunit 6